MWRRKHNRRRAVPAACLSSRCASRGRVVLRLIPRFALLACLICPRWFHWLIRSSLPRRLAFFSSAHRLAPFLVSPGSPPHSTSGTGRSERRAIIDWRVDGGERRTDGGVCLLASDGDGLRAVIDGGWLRAAGVAVCLPRGDRRSGSIVPRSLLFSHHRLIQSARPVSFHHLIASSHRLISSTGRNLLFLSARPPPACSSRSACLGLFPRPRPGDVRAAAWLAAGGWPVCLRFHLSCRSLADARSLVAIRSVSIVPLVPSWGVVGRFMGYSTRYLVGVGIFKYMPLNRILWLLTGIFGDGVRCLFSALPVATVSPVCPALRPLSAAVSWRWCGHVYAASLGKRRVCVLS